MSLYENNNLNRIAWRYYRSDGSFCKGNGSRVFNYQEALSFLNFLKLKDIHNEYDYFIE